MTGMDAPHIVAAIALAAQAGHGPALRAAALDFVPLLFILYVVYAIVSSLFKMGKQAMQSVKTAPPVDDASQPPIQADARLVLQRRLAAAAAARAEAARAASAARVQAAVGGANAAPPVSALASRPPPLPAMPDTLQAQVGYDSVSSAASGTLDLASLMASLPLAARAVLASAVIGPCAAHRGVGHEPEDW